MPTVAEWRAWMTSTGIPQAQAYLAAHPGASQAIAYKLRMEAGETLTPEELASVRVHCVATLDSTTPGETDRSKWRGPSIADQWLCQKNLLEVEAIKTDEVRAAELAAKDLRGCYKLGDVVQVFEDGTPFVNPPAPPFYIVEITGLSKALAEKYTQPQVDLTDPENPIMVRRRKYGIVVADLPAAVKDALLTNRYVKRTWTQVRTYIRNKVTGVGE